MGCPQSTCNSDTALATAPCLPLVSLAGTCFICLPISCLSLQHCSHQGPSLRQIPFPPILSDMFLEQNEIQIVQASLLGSILANLLLILGMCFLFGGLRFREQVTQHPADSFTMAKQKTDIQQYRDTNERMLTQLECHEPIIARESLDSLLYQVLYTLQKWP